jgi:hypothetical protein
MRLLLLTFLLACSQPKHKAVETHSSLEEVKKKRDLYIELAKQHTDESGWLDFECDALLFNSIAAFSGFPVDPTLARQADGKWLRHPKRSCYPEGSKSSISKDMFNGLMLWAFANGRADVLQQVYDYGDANDWIMGEAVDFATLMSRVAFAPTMVYRLKVMIDALNPSLMGVVIDSTDEGLIILRQNFEAHLHIVTILQNYLINKAITDGELAVLKAYTELEPNNALFHAMYGKFTGDQSKAIKLLMDESHFPNDALPTSANHCASYLWQEGELEYTDHFKEFFEWRPCPQNKTHSGVDLMFVTKIMEL